MKNSRREFLKKTGITGATLASAGLFGCSRQSGISEPFPQNYKQVFNMSGYGAPKLDVVRIGIIGLGNRGTGTASRLASIEGVEIKALCDLEPDRVKRSMDIVGKFGHKPDSYSGNDNEWRKVCERTDIDLIAVVTPWDSHTDMCVTAMEHEKHAYVELPAATTVEDCWRLVETSEKTRKHCVQMASNCHYGISSFVLSMARQGFFGDIIHAEGAYIHELIPRHLFRKGFYHNNWRIRENIGKSGNLYPQHGLVPIIQMLDINYGDKMDYLVSISSDDFSMNEKAKQLAEEDDFWRQFVGSDFRGNMNTTVIRTNKGRSIMMQHDVSSPRPDVRFNLISGNKGIFQARPNRIATSHDGWLPDEETKELIEKYTPEITKKFNDLIARAEKTPRSGHSYSRVTPTDWRLVDCLRNGLPMDMDVYEAAVSSVVTPLSVWSIENRNSVVVPDFTNGAWQTNPRGMDIELQKGNGATTLL
jgi:hypothetical protein